MIQAIRPIRAFLAVARLGSFTKASAELNISQPALTMQIQQLEEALSLRLLDRDNRRVSLTQAGRSLLDPLSRVIADLDAVVATGHDMAGLRGGVVRVATLPSVAASLLPMAILAFRQRYPAIRVSIDDVVGDRIIEAVKTETADFGIGGRPPHRDRELAVDDLMTDHMYAFFPENHPLARNPHPALREVAAYPLILTASNSSTRVLVDRALEKEDVAISLAGEANYMSSAIGMVRAGLGVSILPQSAVDTSSCLGVAWAPVKSVNLLRRVGLIRKAGRSLAPAAEAFIDVLRYTVDQPHPYFAKVDRPRAPARQGA